MATLTTSNQVGSIRPVASRPMRSMPITSVESRTSGRRAIAAKSGMGAPFGVLGLTSTSPAFDASRKSRVGGRRAARAGDGPQHGAARDADEEPETDDGTPVRTEVGPDAIPNRPHSEFRA